MAADAPRPPPPYSSPRSAPIVRSRLVARLAQRFEVRLTLLTGGGGSGKTTALSQAIDAATGGIDVFHPCTAADRDRSRLMAGLLAACEQGLDAAPLASDLTPQQAIVDHVLAASPRHVCLVIDDAHLLTDVEPIEALLVALPANGHVLLAGRRASPLNTARLDAAGQLAEIDQDELLMTEAEQIEYANARGIDLARLAGAEGWPAFVELASAGTEARSRRYLEQEALASLTPERRRNLARFAFVGGGDDDLATAVTGLSLRDLLDGIPLVRRMNGEARLHDLWADMLHDELDAEDRAGAALAAAAVHRAAGRIDVAMDLGVLVGDGDDIVRTVAVAVRTGIDGGLHRDRLDRWSDLLAAFAPTAPITLLVDGLIERERDSTSPATWQLFDDAARRFAELGDAELELVALAQLGYAARCLHDGERVDGVMQRLTLLAERHPPARPFLAFGEAWAAIMESRADLQLAAMERIADADLPRMWQVTRDHLRAHALFSLGRAHEAMRWVPRGMADLPVPIPGSLTTESQCHWHAGQPEIALALAKPVRSDRHALRDRYTTTAWAGALAAYAGDTARASRLVAELADLAGERLGPVDAIFRPGVEAVIDIARGDEASAAARLRGVFERAPLGKGISEQALRGHVAIPYVLVPESRCFWDDFATGPSMVAALDCARALIESRARSDDRVLASFDWPETGMIAAALPARWAVELALRGVRAGCHEGRALAAWLCTNWGNPARELLRSFADDADLGTVAGDVMSNTPSPPVNEVRLRLLGQTTLLVDDQPSREPNWRRERVRALLVWLVLHPSTTRELAAGALWPDLEPERAAKNLRTTLNYLHGVLEPRRSSRDATWFVRVSAQHLELHSELDVDLWRYRALLEQADIAERAGRAGETLALLGDAVALWHGDLAADLDYEWLELERIHLRSRFVRASCRLAELLTATSRPNQAIERLRPALAADPWHARSYVALAAAYAAVGDQTSARAVERRAETLGVA